MEYAKVLTETSGLPAKLPFHQGRLVPLAYLLGVTVAEVLTNLAAPTAGLVLHGLLLLALLAHSALTANRRLQRLLLAVALAPLTRLLSLSLPLPHFQFIYWYLIVGVPLFLGAFVVLRVTGYSPRRIGLSAGALPTQLLVGLTGLGLGYVEYRILRPEPLVQTPTLANLWLPIVILGIFTGLLEEVIFRGLMQHAAIVYLGRWGIVFVATLSAVLHIGYRSVIDVAFVFAVGLFFAVVVERTRSILGVTLAHTVTNVALFLIMPFVIQGPAPVAVQATTRFELVKIDRVAQIAPSAIEAGQSITATVVIANHERGAVGYTVFVTTGGRVLALSPIISLEAGGVRQQGLRFTLPQLGRRQLVDITLHRNGRPEPIRRIQLVIEAGPASSP